MSINRRDFNKTMAALFGSLTLPAIPAVAGVTPLAPGVITQIPAHYGFTTIGMSTSFKYEPFMGLGQLSCYEQDIEKLQVDMDFSFICNPAGTMERTIRMEGDNKEWRIEKEPKSVSQIQAVHDDVLSLADPTSSDDEFSKILGIGNKSVSLPRNNTLRRFYATSEIEVFVVGSNLQDQVKLTDMECFKCYDVVMYYNSHDPDISHQSGSVVLRDFEVVYTEDFVASKDDMEIAQMEDHHENNL